MTKFALTANGSVHNELRSRPAMSAEDELERRVSIQDGTTRFALALWKFPDNISFDRLNIDRYSQEFVQCAGGGDRMFVEWRYRASPVDFIQFAVGKKDSFGDEWTEIVWDGVRTKALEREVLNSAMVSRIFREYFTRDGTLSDAWLLRKLEF